MMRRARFLLCCVPVIFLAAACDRQVDNAGYAPRIEALTSSAPSWVGKGTLPRKLWAIERAFYAQRGNTPAWIDGVKGTERLDELLTALSFAGNHGLDPASYGTPQLTADRDRAKTKYGGVRFEQTAVPDLDARLTYAYLRYAADLLAWGAPARQVYVNWLVEPKQEDLATRLQQAVEAGAIGKSLDELAPTHPQYRGLQAALVRERANPSGHEDTIRMNLERWRWAPRDLGEHYILVNVPAYTLQVMDGDKPTLAMRVIVGAKDTPTPLFSDEMRYVVFSPYWNIPDSILQKETLPHLAKDPDYLQRNHLEVVGTSGTVDPAKIDWSDESATKDIRIRQAPGPENALGLVKFIFPNHFNVYLHDTADHRLFNRAHRALSHGCIRVERPVDLASFVLRGDSRWTGERIVDAMQGKEEQTVSLKERLPVHIGYWTAWVGPNGEVAYTDDPYGIDAAHAKVWAGHPDPVRGEPTGD